uniref:Uncharacterized protein n=1 Tax=Rhizophora mucronata TaxID=61149 RepID=A0A2P2MIG1_RHIMU
MKPLQSLIRYKLSVQQTIFLQQDRRKQRFKHSR